MLQTFLRWGKYISRGKSAPEWKSFLIMASFYQWESICCITPSHPSSNTHTHTHALAELWFHYGCVLNHKRHICSFLGAPGGGANGDASQGSEVCEVKRVRYVCPWLLIMFIDSSRFLLSHGHPSRLKFTVPMGRKDTDMASAKAANS